MENNTKEFVSLCLKGEFNNAAEHVFRAGSAMLMFEKLRDASNDLEKRAEMSKLITEKCTTMRDNAIELLDKLNVCLPDLVKEGIVSNEEFDVINAQINGEQYEEIKAFVLAHAESTEANGTEQKPITK